MTQFKYIHEVCVRVGGRTLRHNRIVTHGAPHETSAIINYYRFPPWPVLKALNAYRLCSTLIEINNNNKKTVLERLIYSERNFRDLTLGESLTMISIVLVTFQKQS